MAADCDLFLCFKLFKNDSQTTPDNAKLVFILLWTRLLPVPSITAMSKAVPWHAHTGLSAAFGVF